MRPDTQREAFVEVMEWLDSHVNYERTGPQAGGDGGFLHDPERRLRHLRALMELMDEPQKAYRSIHITGTNGKTSTARMVSALVAAHGLRPGLYTSPHLETLNERIVVDDEPIEDEALVELLESVRLLEPMLGGERLSYFEILTAAAFRHFADAPVDVAVVEVGVGGRWDATNVIDAPVAVVTNIALDHAGYLGPTRRDIAGHKAGIIKPGNTAVIGETDPELMDFWAGGDPARTLVAGRDFGVEADQVAVGGRVATLRTPAATYEDVFIPLHGAHQSTNAAIALAAVEALFDRAIDAAVVRKAFDGVRSPGRLEVVHRQPLCVIDGAHNVAGASALAAALDEDFGTDTARTFVVGLLNGHDPEDMLRALDAGRARMVLACTAPSPRAIPAAEIAAAAKRLGVPVAVVERPGDALRQALEAAAEDEMIVVTGSLYVAGAARSAARGSQLP